jgi:hypothetical protein
MLNGSDLSVFSDWIAGLLVVALAAMVVLKLSAVYYRRTA